MENLGADSDYILKNLVALKMTEKYFPSHDNVQVKSFPLEIKDGKNMKRMEVIDMDKHKYQFK